MKNTLSKIIPNARIRQFLENNNQGLWFGKGFWRPGDRPSVKRRALPVPSVAEINVAIESMRLNHGTLTGDEIDRTKRKIIGHSFISSPEIIDEVFGLSEEGLSIYRKNKVASGYVRFPKDCVPVASTSLGGLLVVQVSGSESGTVYLYDDDLWEEDVRDDSVVSRDIENLYDILVDPTPTIHAKLLDDFKKALRAHGLSDVVNVRVVGKAPEK